MFPVILEKITKLYDIIVKLFTLMCPSQFHIVDKLALADLKEGLYVHAIQKRVGLLIIVCIHDRICSDVFFFLFKN